MNKRDIVTRLKIIKENSKDTYKMLESRNILARGIDDLIEELRSKEPEKLSIGELFINIDVDFSDAIYSQNDVQKIISYIKGLNAAVHKDLSKNNKINLGVDINE